MSRPRCRVAPFMVATTILITLVLSTGPPDRAASQTAGNQLVRSVFSGGGSPAWDSVWSVGSFGQPSPIGIPQGRTTTLYSGFWGPGQRGTDAPSAPRISTRLEQNIPNPFNPSTRIEYQIAMDAFVSIEVINLQGRIIQVLVHEPQSAGAHHVTWLGRDEDGREVASGVYFYRLQVEQHREVKRMLLLK